MATDEASIQRELLAQLEELNRISMVVSPERSATSGCARAPKSSMSVPCVTLAARGCWRSDTLAGR
jgi:hypothetical protein